MSYEALISMWAFALQSEIPQLTKSVLQEGEGVSRDDIAAALLEVTAGRIPRDRIALRELAQEVKTWPYLDAEEQLEAETGTASNYEGITDTGGLSNLTAIDQIYKMKLQPRTNEASAPETTAIDCLCQFQQQEGLRPFSLPFSLPPNARLAA